MITLVTRPRFRRPGMSSLVVQSTTGHRPIRVRAWAFCGGCAATQLITIASSGLLNLETEALDLLIAPRPKRASLVSLAKPVKIKGSLSEPEISVAKIPRKGRLLVTGALSALINPALLLFAFSDTGTGEANPCESAVERAHKDIEADRQ